MSEPQEIPKPDDSGLDPEVWECEVLPKYIVVLRDNVRFYQRWFMSLFFGFKWTRVKK